MVVFGGGAAIGVVSVLATDIQHSYYRNARDLKGQLEDKLGLEEHAIATTKGRGGGRKRIAKIQNIQKFMLVSLIVADLTGLGVSIARAAIISGRESRARGARCGKSHECGAGGGQPEGRHRRVDHRASWLYRHGRGATGDLLRVGAARFEGLHGHGDGFFESAAERRRSMWSSSGPDQEPDP